MYGGLKYYLESLADLALPRSCIVCGRQLGTMERQLCIYCTSDFPYTYFWTSRYNQMSLRLNEMADRDREQDGGEGVFSRFSYAAALFFYHSEAGYKNIPRYLKYRKRISAGKYFAGLLASRLYSSEYFRDVDMIVPVPLHPRRRRERGYNQAEIIAAEISMTGGCPMKCDLLKRTRYTPTQTRLPVEAKGKNVRSAFCVDSRSAEKISPSHILVVDDVFTTGATMNACRKSLCEFFGPRVRISAATLGFVNSG